MAAESFVELAKAARAVPQSLLFSLGLYGGGFAKEFPPRFVEAAGGLCLGAAFTGAVLLTFVAIKVTLYPGAS